MSKVYKAAVRDLNAGQLALVYIVIGDEEWSRERFLKLLKSKVVDPEMADFNYDQLVANEVKGQVVVDKVCELPMMSDRRMVMVTECEKWKARDLEAVTKYLADPNEKACLVLLFTSADRRRKLFQNRSKAVRYLEFARPKSWELNDTIRDLASDMKLRLNEEAVSLIADLAGDDLAKVKRELDKLSLYKLGSSRISKEDVEALMGRTRQVTRWELNDFISKRDLGGALIKLHAIIASGEDPISLLSAVNMHIKRLFTVKTLMMKGIKDHRMIGQAIGVSPKIAGNLVDQQGAYSDREMRAAFTLMRETDLRLKSAAINKKLLLDHLITQIVAVSPLSPPRQRRG